MNKNYNFSFRALASKLMLTSAFALLCYVSFAQVNAYTFGSASGTYTPLSGGRTILGCGLTGITDQSHTVNLPFTFAFDKSCYDQVHISSNGFATFGNKNQFNLIAPISGTTTGYTGTSFAVASPYGRDLVGSATGDLSYEILGSAPNRQFVIQWDDVQNAGNTRMYDFQLVLNEGGGVAATQTVQFVYGTFVGTGTATTAQVGLRGQNNTQFFNRSTATNWAATIAGGANSASCTVTTAVIPASGLTFTFTPGTLACIAPAITRIAHTSTTTADVFFNDACNVMPGIGYLLEYGPIGYVAGTGAAAGAGGTLVSPATSPYTVTSATAVDIYLRRECTPGVYSANSLVGKFIPSDECESAVLIDCTNNAGAGYSAVTAGYTVGASPSAGQCGAGPQFGIHGLSKWYKYVGNDQQVTAQLCGTAAGADSRLSVYVGSCGNFTCITGNDDCSASSFESTVQFAALNGFEYYIVLGHFSAGGSVASGTLQVSCSVACSPGDTNDSENTPQALALGVTYNDNNECASGGPVANVSAVCGGSFSTLLDNWYTFTSSASVTDHAISLSSSASPAPQADGPIYYAVYTPNPCGGFVYQFCGASTQNSNIPVTLALNTAYVLRVYASSDDAGNYILGNFDITVNGITCPQPLDLGALAGDTYATLTWTQDSSAPDWEVEWGTAGFAPTGTANITGSYPGTASIASGLTPATAYEFYVRDECGPGDFSFWSGPYAFTTGTYANDGCLGALPITCAGAPYTGSTVGAGVDVVDGSALDCVSTGFGTHNGVWFVYAGDNQEVTINLCNAGTDFDTQISVYSGACNALTCVAANDDLGAACTTGPGTAAFKSSVTFNAYTGTNYYVFVAGYSDTDEGVFQLDMSCTVLCLPVPGNDLCANATALTVTNGSCSPTSGSTACASASTYANPTCLSNAFGSYGDVWYSFVATDPSHDVRIDLGSSTDIVVNFFFEASPPVTDCSTQLTSFGCLEWSAVNNPSGADVQVTGMTPGETIWLRVLSETGATGTFDICVWENPCPFPTQFNLSGVTQTAFDLTWQENGSATQWDVYYGVAPVSPEPDDLTTPTIDNTTNPTSITGLTANTAYNVWVRSDNPGQSCTSVWVGPFTITTLPTPPPNDVCASAIALNCGDQVSTNTSAGSTDTETNCVNNTAVTSNGIYFTYAGDGSVVTVDLSGSNFDSMISVYEGTCAAHTCVAGDDDSGAGLTSLVSFQSFPGINYIIYVHGFGTASGLVELEITCAAPAPGDFPSNALSMTNSGNAYPNCGVITVDYSGLNPSTENTVGLGGPDIWYKFTAISNAVQITVNGATTDDVIQIFNSTATTVINTEDQGFLTSDIEVLNYDGLTPGTQYLICVSDWNGVGGLVTICFKQMLASTCDNGPGAYPMCSNFKPDYTGANNYTFNFTPTSFAGPTTTGSSTGQISLGSASLALQYGASYSVTINGTFNVLDGAGAPETLNVPGIATCAISIPAHADVQVKATQWCPATLLKGSILQGKPFVCGVLNYTVEATELNGCAGSTVGLPFTGTTSGSSASIALANINTGGAIVGGGKWYSIRYRPNFTYGPGSFGTARVIFVGGSAMDTEVAGANNAEERTAIEVEANLYPNPSTGDMVNLNIANIDVDNVFVNITDMQGRVVYTNRYTVDGSLNTIVTFAQPLANGVYNVQFIIGNEILNEKLMVQK
jgi:hypothetical protein